MKRERASLRDLSARLLRLHAALLERARRSYEHRHGAVTPRDLLPLLIHDEHFAWLRPLSGMIAGIDEVVDTAEVDRGPGRRAPVRAGATAAPLGRLRPRVPHHVPRRAPGVAGRRDAARRRGETARRIFRVAAVVSSGGRSVMSESSRAVVNVVRPEPVVEGAGVRLRRSLGHEDARLPRSVPAPRSLRVRRSGRLPGRVPVPPPPGHRDGHGRPHGRDPPRGLARAQGHDRRRRHPVDDVGERHHARGDAAGAPGGARAACSSGSTCPRARR